MKGTMQKSQNMKNAPSVLLAGVPFGRNNVGDEAILECVVKIVRKACPAARITVSTDDPDATARKLHVETVELFGFEPPYSEDRMRKTLRENDVFIWSGATGLSDYPQIPTRMLRFAQRAHRKTVVWGVGMNTELNPVFYSTPPGSRKHQLLSSLSAALPGHPDLIAAANHRLDKKGRALIRRALEKTDLIAVRDPESLDELRRCGVHHDVLTGADSALLLDPAPLDAVALPDEVHSLLTSGKKIIGVCISAQREISNQQELTACLDELVKDDATRILFIPMNPLTDSILMERLRDTMRFGDRSAVVVGRYEPAEILAVTSQCDVIVSSRLHLLIFASIVHVPFIGISRGSKVNHFLNPYGLRPAGSVESCDFDFLKNEIRRLLHDRDAFVEKSRSVRRHLLARLDVATDHLQELLRAE